MHACEFCCCCCSNEIDSITDWLGGRESKANCHFISTQILCLFMFLGLGGVCVRACVFDESPVIHPSIHPISIINYFQIIPWLFPIQYLTFFLCPHPPCRSYLPVIPFLVRSLSPATTIITIAITQILIIAETSIHSHLNYFCVFLWFHSTIKLFFFLSLDISTYIFAQLRYVNSPPPFILLFLDIPPIPLNHFWNYPLN